MTSARTHWFNQFYQQAALIQAEQDRDATFKLWSTADEIALDVLRDAGYSPAKAAQVLCA